MSEEQPQLPEIKEVTGSSPEQFIPLEQMTRLVESTLAFRFDESGKLLPLQERRAASSPQYLRRMLPPVEHTDLVLGPNTEPVVQGDEKIRSSWGYNIDSKLYATLTEREKIILSAEEIRNLKKEREAFLEAIKKSDRYEGNVNCSQLHDSVRVHKTSNEPIENDLAGPTRVYLHAGVKGVHIARRMIEEGADFDGAKIWVPDFYEGEQFFRRDAPLFEAKNTTQLQSLIDTLRVLAANGELPAETRKQPLVGHTVDGLPGIYVGQTKEGSSFNRMMTDLFASPINDAVITDTMDTPIHAGEQPPAGWFEKVAADARERAMAQAEEVGVNPNSHALLREQDPAVVTNCLRRVA
jgi:hypothetical protein